MTKISGKLNNLIQKASECSPLLNARNSPFNYSPNLSQQSLSTTSSPNTNTNTSTKKNKLRLGLDAEVVDTQKKWKRLTEIRDENSTAKNMASEVQHEFKTLRKQGRQLSILPQSPEESSYVYDANTEEMMQSGLVQVEIHNKIYDIPVSIPLMELEINRYRIATAFIKDAIHGRKIGYRLDKTALTLTEIFHSSWYRNLYTLIVFICCSLALVEQPPNLDAFFCIDIICVLLFTIDVWIRWAMSSNETKKKFRSREPWAFVRILLLIITVVDIITMILFPTWNKYRYTRALRPFFLITRRRNIRIIFGSFLRALRQVLVVLLLMFCLVGFFGLLGYLLFSGVQMSIAALEPAPFFASISSAMYTMLLIQNCLPYMVTAMAPYFRMTQWSAVYFILFVLLTNLFLSKLTIAVSYRSYKRHTEQMMYKRLQKRKAALFAAFDILAEDWNEEDEANTKDTIENSLAENDKQTLLMNKPTLQKRGSSRYFGLSFRDRLSRRFSTSLRNVTDEITDEQVKERLITLQTWVKLCFYLKPEWTEADAILVFNSIDIYHTEALNESDFYQLCSLLSVKLERSNYSFFISKRMARRVKLKKLQHTIRRGLLYEVKFGKEKQYSVVLSELLVGALICLSVVQAVQVNNITLAFSTNHIWRLIGFTLLILFTLEIVLKLFAFGIRGFLQRPFCKLDFMIAFVGWVFYILTSFYTTSTFTQVFYDLALAIRSLRILKLLNLVPQFHSILSTMGGIFALMLQLLIVIFSVMYSFAILTQANYGQLLSNFPPRLAAEAPAWFVNREEFQVNTFQQTLVTLFGVSNLAGWNMVMDAAHAMTQSHATLVFFFTYRIIMSNILLPIFVGFLVESFVSHEKRSRDDGKVLTTSLMESEDRPLKFKSVEDLELNPGPNFHRSSVSRSKSIRNLIIPDSHDSDLSDYESEKEVRLKVQRRESLVQNEMFDPHAFGNESTTNEKDAVNQLKLDLAKKEDLVSRHRGAIRTLESKVSNLEERCNESRHAILTYETKMEDLTETLSKLQQETADRELLIANLKRQLRHSQEGPVNRSPKRSFNLPTLASFRIWQN